MKLFLISSLLAACAAPPISAAIIGTNPPAPGITAERIAALPADQQAAWRDYLARSERQGRADRAYVQAELAAAGRAAPAIPPEGRPNMPLDRPADWYGGGEAVHTADVIVSYQMPNGGWGKNLSMRDHVRQPGESFIGNNLSHYLTPGDYDEPRDRSWNYFGTLDNDATTTQLRFLAHVITAVGPAGAAPYQAAFVRGIDYLCAAQYPNGGWPQVWPLEGGYHDAITFNDDAVTQAVEVLAGVAEGRGIYAFASPVLRARAAPRAADGVACMLATQIRVQGRRTVWCQQHDALTLQPVSARNFEPPAQCAEESAQVASLLMTWPHPSPGIIAAVDAAVAWFKKTAITGEVWNRSKLRGASRPVTALAPRAGAGPIWARYYEIGTDRPVFGDRDKTIHDRVQELSLERQYGYSWFNDAPAAALATYPGWRAAHPAP